MPRLVISVPGYICIIFFFMPLKRCAHIIFGNIISIFVSRDVVPVIGRGLKKIKEKTFRKAKEVFCRMMALLCVKRTGKHPLFLCTTI